MSCKNFLERSEKSQNKTMEIENEIKEMKIVDAYERQASNSKEKKEQPKNSK